MNREDQFLRHEHMFSSLLSNISEQHNCKLPVCNVMPAFIKAFTGCSQGEQENVWLPLRYQLQQSIEELAEGRNTAADTLG